MVVITIFGVGYGEVRPVDTWQLRTLTGFVIVAGYGAVIYAVGGFIQLVVDGEINQAFGARKMTKEIKRMHKHAIICGLGRMGTSLADQLRSHGQPFVAIDSSPDALAHAEAQGWTIINGDAQDPPTDHLLHIGDRVIVLGYHDDIPSLGSRSSPRKITYRGVTSEM